MLETDLQHGVRRRRFLTSERIARRYRKCDKSCTNDRMDGCTRIGKLEKVFNAVEIYLVAKAKDEKPTLLTSFTVAPN